MPEIQYPTNPNSDTAFVVQDDGTKNRALMTAPQDTSTLELPSNANSTKGYVTINGKKQRVILTADIGGGSGGDAHNKGYFATLAELQEAYPTGEAGDWAIVAESDTVYIWDDTQQAWVDTDQKGQVTSVNGQTGDVTLTIPDAVQYSTMPTASADNLGDIVQFIGTTDANYTNGYFYKCVSDGQNPATYSWTRVDVQPAPVIPDPLPSQTGQSGKFLTTDGTDASWATISALQNTATGTDSLGILNNTPGDYNTLVGVKDPDFGSSITGGTTLGYKSVVGNADNGIALGRQAKVGHNNTSNGGIAIGYLASTTYGGLVSTNAICIGRSSHATGDRSLAIGSQAVSGAAGAIQLGGTSTSAATTNPDANTFKVANANGNFEIMSADGTVPADRLASTTGLADGNYRLRLTMSNGTPTLSWVAE